MPEIERDVKMAVLVGCETRLTGQFPTMPIKHVAVTFNPPNDQKYIEVIQLANDTKTTWGDEKQFRGFIRLILHWPVDGAGAIVPYQMQSDIAALFAQGTRLESGGAVLQVSGHPDLMDVIEDGHENLYPVTCAYEFFALST